MARKGIRTIKKAIRKELDVAIQGNVGPAPFCTECNAQVTRRSFSMMLIKDCLKTLLVKRNSYAERCGRTTAPTAKLTVSGGDLALQTTKKVILDSDDSSDTYMVHDSTNDRVSIYVDGIEMVRINK